MVDLAQEPNEPHLRQRLDEITGLPRDQVPNHVDMVAKLADDYSHRIEPAAETWLEDLPVETYTCFMHACGLENSDVVVRIASVLNDVYPSREFIDFLVSHHLVEVAAPGISDGDLVVYSDSEKIMHAGISRGGRVISKWGRGLLWKHRLFEVPARYGDRVRFYRPIPTSAAEQAFIAYAKARAGAEAIDQLLAN
jgi:hypothetical protein